MEHDTGSHPENALRLKCIMETIKENGILEKLTRINPEKATAEQVAMFHRPEYIEKVAQFARAGGGYIDPDTVVSRKSFEVALKAVGGALTAVDYVLSGRLNSAFALVRPPGHHAVAGRSMGFCLFNNIAIAALHAREKYGLERILIVDWDVHHGNGTSEAFFSDPGVLFFSTHQQGIFPGAGRVSEVGQGEGEGYTINVPLNRGTGDAGLYYAFTQLLEPVARQYKPQLVMVSAGFDGHHSDPLAGLSMTVPGYARIAEIVRKIADEECDGKIVASLEGGYNLSVIGHSVSAMLNVLGDYGMTIDEPGGAPPGFDGPTMRDSIEEALKVHKRYWKL